MGKIVHTRLSYLLDVPWFSVTRCMMVQFVKFWRHSNLFDDRLGKHIEPFG